MLCRTAGIDFISFPIPDRGVPESRAEARALVEAISARGTKHAVAIHCRAGIGRSSLIAGMVLVLAGLSADDALDAIGRARGLTVPDTDGQIAWLRGFEDEQRSI
ncbi:protein-tyrosine phosphatase family protein [Sphingomonas sp. AR_OL41]|jgi:protein-tyrosine phosphatase|uniref:protein-tyrosine phosphatase family protein n=1 Tax=Sphingomonas sp. AR_OL41 TaxID=3042729 RepID=UPI002480ACC0|nr:protein-tyrosine phosphatase family protein [Sphingomonas sp. AR_OL41]MDH7974602.1 protein-tyrosine phosphatase family protein [Sphingomonas sp. AR_OL41]